MLKIRYKNHVYTVLAWSTACHLMEIKKDSGTIARFVRYLPNTNYQDFCKNLEKVNFYEV